MGHPQGLSSTTPKRSGTKCGRCGQAAPGWSYARLEHESINWPCPGEDHPGTPVLHRQRFAHAERTALQAIPFIASSEQCDADYPLLLTTGRTLYHFNAGTEVIAPPTPNCGRAIHSTSRRQTPTDWGCRKASR